MTPEYDKLEISGKIVINIEKLAKDTRYKEMEEPDITGLTNIALRDLKHEYVISEDVVRADHDVCEEPFIAVYLFGLLDGYQKLNKPLEQLPYPYKVRYYHHNVVSNYVEKGKDEFLEIIAELEEAFRARKRPKEE